MLDTLPIDVIKLVLDHIYTVKDLKHLCQVSRKLYHYTRPNLYASITIRAEESHLATLDVDRFKVTNTESLQYTRDLEFVAEIHVRLRSRCVPASFFGHQGPIDDLEEYAHDSDDDLLVEGDDELIRRLRLFNARDRRRHTITHSNKIVWQILPFLSRLKSNSLRKFSWRLGACVPQRILYHLGTYQRHIESLTFITDYTCWGSKPNVDLELLGYQPRLRHVSWIGRGGSQGCVHEEEWDALRFLILGHAHQLERLEIDFLHWNDDSEEYRLCGRPIPPNYLATGFFHIELGKEKVVLPALKTLSLSSVSFWRGGAELARAMNMRNLRSLKLRNCQGENELLDMLAHSAEIVHLKSFELTQRSTKSRNQQDNWNIQNLVNFLESFEGLEELCILSDPSEDPIDEDYWWSILHHKATLKRLVHHQRQVELGYGGRPESYFIHDISPFYGDINHVFMLMPSLDFMGFHCTLHDMAIMVRTARPRPCWPVLHIRTAGLIKKRPADLSAISNRPKTRDVVCGELEDSNFCVPRCIIDPDFATTPVGEKVMTAMPSAPQSLLSFAQWAFGPTGFPDLKVLAYGDFSYNGRHGWQNWLFCKSQFGLELAERGDRLDLAATLNLDLTFREVAKSDWKLQELIDSHSEMLEACPEDTILHTH